MPNGKAGDHWYTDVTSGLPTFSAEVDNLIRGLDQLAAAGRDYTPWDDPARQRIERVVDRHLDAVGFEELSGRTESVGMEYRNLDPAELRSLRDDLKALGAELRAGMS